MKTIDKEILAVSKFMWSEEKAAMNKSKSNLEFTKKFIEVLDPLIDSGKVLYPDLLENIIKKFEELSLSEDYDDTNEGRKALVRKMYSDLTDYYKNLN